MEKPQVDKYIFFICLSVSILLFVLGFVTPPPGVIDGSVLTAGGILFGFAALGVVGQTIANGKELTWRKGDMEISVEDTGCQCQTIDEETDQ
jgi:hypothetical protein